MIRQFLGNTCRFNYSHVSSNIYLHQRRTKVTAKNTMSAVIYLSSFDEYKFDTMFGKGYCEHTITGGSGLVGTEKWNRLEDLGRGGVWRGLVRKCRGGGKLRAVKKLYTIPEKRHDRHEEKEVGKEKTVDCKGVGSGRNK